MSLQTKERILFCGTYDEYYFIIIDKIDNNYKINICNEYVYFIDNIYDVSREFFKYIKIIIESLYKKIYPEGPNGLPIYNPSGKYWVKLFFMG